MATVDLATKFGAGLAISGVSATRAPYYVEQTLNFATAVTTKGSALAAADVIQIIDIPAQHQVISAGFEVITAVAGGVSVLTVSLGTTAAPAQPAAYVSAYDLFAAVAGDYPPNATAGYTLNTKAANTLDVLIASLTGVLATGVIRVWAWLGDVSDLNRPGIALLKS